MKKLAGLAALIFAGCTVTFQQENSRELRVFPTGTHLIVNPGLPHYCVGKTKEEGEAELVALAARSDLEEAFFYDAKITAWAECGEEETPFSCKSKLSRISGDFYHIHPAGVSELERLLEKMLQAQVKIDELSTVVDEKNKDMAQAKNLLRFHSSAKKYIDAIPSPGDLTAYRIAKSTQMSVASKHGIVDYVVTPMADIEWTNVNDAYHAFVIDDLAKVFYDVDQFNERFSFFSERDTVADGIAAINARFTGKIKLTYRQVKPAE